MKQISSKKTSLLIFSLMLYSFISFSICPFPIGFAISETKIVTEIPRKDRDFASIIPGKLSTYIYQDESEYYKDYQRSYFGITRRKGGWDCLRHYEILANGCIPYFIDIDQCNPNTMHFLPRELIKQAMHLPGVSYGKIDHKKFDAKKYYEILKQLLEHTRTYLTTTSMARYLLETMHYSGGKVLFLGENKAEDYMKVTLLIGLKELINEQVIDVPRLDYIYKDFSENASLLYGKGFSYSKVVDDYAIDRTNIEARIKNKEFEIIIYAYVHYGLPLYACVTNNYPADKIAYICGEDAHHCPFTHLQNLFLREYDSL